MGYPCVLTFRFRFAESWFPSLPLTLFAGIIEHFSAIAFQEFVFPSKKVGFKMEHIILLKRSYLRDHCTKYAFILSHHFLLKPLFPQGTGQGNSEGQKPRRQHRKQTTITTSITHSIFWNFVRCPIPLFCRCLES